MAKHYTKLTKKIPKDLKNDWDDQPGKARYSRIHRMMASNDTRILNTYGMSEKNTNPTPNFSTIYGLKNKEWVQIGKKCLDCGKALSNPDAIYLHPEICDHSLKINKSDDEENEILKLVKGYKHAYKKD